MAVLAIAGVGAALGGAALYGAGYAAIGASIGWAIGSYVGNQMFAGGSDVENVGPRLEDLKVQTSTYGAPIPHIFGALRVAGNLIWSSGLIETVTVTEEETGGKGGGGSSVTTTSYSYSASFAIGLCAGEIATIGRIWFDGKIFLDLTGVVDQQYRDYITIYTGSETQTADPTIQSYEGAANTPAYRGLAYIVFEDIELANYGNRLPNVTVEVSTTGSLPEYLTPTAMIDESFEASGYDYSWDGYNTSNGTLSPNTTPPAAAPAGWQTRCLQCVASGSDAYAYLDADLSTIDPAVYAEADFIVDSHNMTEGMIRRIFTITELGRRTGAFLHYLSGTLRLAFEERADWDSYTNHYMTGAVALDTLYKINIKWDLRSQKWHWQVNSVTQHSGSLTVDASTRADDDFSGDDGDQPDDTIWNSNAVANITIQSNQLEMATPYNPEINTSSKCHFSGDFDIQIMTPNVPNIPTAGNNGWHAYLEFWIDNNNFAQCDVGLLHTGSPYTYEWKGVVTVGGVQVAQNYSPSRFSDTDGGFRIVRSGGTINLYYWGIPNSGAWNLMTSYASFPASEGYIRVRCISNRVLALKFDDFTVNSGTPIWTPAVRVGPQYDSGDPDITMYIDNVVIDNGTYWSPSVIGAEPTIGSIVSDLCLDAGLTAGEIDVTALTDTVHGYVRGSVMSARRAIEPLLFAGLIDVAEVDQKLEFIPRGNSSAATITADELGAAADSSQSNRRLIETRAEEPELPSRLEIKFLHSGRNYETDVRYKEFYFPTSDNVQVIDLPMAMTATRALQAADILLPAAWEARSRFSFGTGPKYMYLAPADVVTVNGRVMRITNMGLAGGLLSFECASEYDPALFSSSLTSVENDSADEYPFEPGDTTAMFIDCPAFNENGNSAGYYLAAYGEIAAWIGCVVYYSSDGGSNFSRIKDITAAATVGTTDDALGDQAAGNYNWDLENTLTVQLLTPGKTLASADTDAVLNGANAALVGVAGAWEIIQFADVVDNGGDNYTLSTLLRGRRGTEWAMGGHAIDDSFILIDSALVRLRLGITQIGLARTYRVDTIGSLTQAVDTEDHTLAAVCLEPYAVEHVSGSRDGSANLTIDWIRRDRIDGEWRDNVDAGLTEDAEAYEIDILDGADVVRTITAATNTASYTAAQQTTDFGSAQSSIDIKIYQLSATVGRGIVKEATV